MDMFSLDGKVAAVVGGGGVLAARWRWVSPGPAPMSRFSTSTSMPPRQSR